MKNTAQNTATKQTLIDSLVTEGFDIDYLNGLSLEELKQEALNLKPKQSPICKFNYTEKQAVILIEKIGKSQGELSKHIRLICEDLMLRFSKASVNPQYGSLTLVNQLLDTLQHNRGAWERVGVWFIKHTGGAVRFDKDTKHNLFKIKGKAFIVGDIEDLPHPLDKTEKANPTEEALKKKEKARLNYDKRVLQLTDKLAELALEYQNDLMAIVTNPEKEKPKMDIATLSKLATITGHNLEPVESVLKYSK